MYMYIYMTVHVISLRLRSSCAVSSARRISTMHVYTSRFFINFRIIYLKYRTSYLKSIIFEDLLIQFPLQSVSTCTCLTYVFALQINPGLVTDHNNSLSSSLSGQGHLGTAPVQWHPSGSIHGSQSVLNRSDGSIIAVTPQREHRTVQSKYVSAKVVKYSRIFSIVAIVCFPPTGLTAFYFARKAARDFELQDQTSAQRHVKYCERLIILSVVLGILLYTLIFAAIGRAAYGNQDTSDGSRATAV